MREKWKSWSGPVFCTFFVPQFNIDGILNPVICIADGSMVIYHCEIGMHIGCNNYVYTKMLKSAEKSKIKDYKISTDGLLISLTIC